MRSSYLVCYDICDDKRLRKVFQGDAQMGRPYSVFECQLRDFDVVRMSNRQLLEVQARLLAKVMEGELAEYPVFVTR